jgi:hypothetical protein
VQVLDHEHRGLFAQRLIDKLADLGQRHLGVGTQRFDLRVPGQVPERPQRPRGQQRVAGSAKDPDPGRLAAGRLDQGRLACPWFAVDRGAGAASVSRAGDAVP